MNFSDIPTGSYILIPCPRCGEKKSRKIPPNRSLVRMRSQICLQCKNDDAPDRAKTPEGRYRVRMLEGFRMMEGN